MLLFLQELMLLLNVKMLLPLSSLI
ncbi:putative proline-rich receptor-like protein kinase PERK13 [Iris pallida]|uniref:Proline-rich receptor-like protein kinase PERK13 n=1 Tax=Iris pallida TaxID=29817 RepID=A0AAX6DLD7_IRIPA|nr:putative proline-rich receptor-like protein kinase PERK13 [Iris pallida]